MEPKSVGDPSASPPTFRPSDPGAEEHERQEAARRRREGEQLWSEATKVDGVDKRHVDALYKVDAQGKSLLWQHRQWREAFDRAWRIVSAGGMVVLLGPRGTGKTQMAAALIRQGCLGGKSCQYVRCRQVGAEIRETYDQKGARALDVIRSYAYEHWLLVLDEVQQQVRSAHERDTLSELIDRRYGQGLPTAMLAPITVQEFSDLMSEDVVSRVHEGGGAIPFDWPSFRNNERT